MSGQQKLIEDETVNLSVQEEYTAAKFATHNQAFKVCCLKAGIHPTKRQAAKFRRGRGLAYATFRSIAAGNLHPLPKK